MPRNEIIVLFVVIVLTATFISLYLNNIFKSKKVKPKQQEKEQPKQEVQKQETPKQDNVQKEEKKHEKEKTKTPQISIALQDELEDFKNYLKSRISDTNSNQPSIHPYEAPKVDRFSDSMYSPNFDRDFKKDFDFPDFDSPLDDAFFDDVDDFSRDFGSYSRNKKSSLNETKIENLPDNVKIMLFSNLFDSKF